MRTRIGLGDVANRIHLPAWKAVSDIELVGVCVPDLSAGENVAMKFGGPQSSSRLDQML